MTNRMNVLLTFVRNRHYTKAWLPDAVKYDLIKYHPVRKDHVDPPIVPSKVLMVHRVKPFKGNPWWEKKILEQIGLQERGNEPVFVKNTPEMCRTLWEVKHLIKIVPVKLPEKVPEMDDWTETFVHPNGSVRFTGKIDPVRYEATMKVKNNPKRLKPSTISEKLRRQWCAGTLI